MFEEKDWFMRQVRHVAEGLSSMVSKETIKDLLNFEQQAEQQLSDEDIEKIILVVQVNQKAHKLNLNEAELHASLNLELETWERINKQHEIPDEESATKLRLFLAY